MYYDYLDVSVLEGLTLKSITVDNNDQAIYFKHEDGREWQMYHNQDCCESVTIDDICGDLNDLIGTPIVMAEESSNREQDIGDNWTEESFLWTFYRFRTIKGDVTIRWYGTSNGYYSESVSFIQIS